MEKQFVGDPVSMGCWLKDAKDTADDVGTMRPGGLGLRNRLYLVYRSKRMLRSDYPKDRPGQVDRSIACNLI